MENLPSADLAWLVKRSVEIEVSNKTRNITLRNPETYFNCGVCSKPPQPVVPPGSSDTSQFKGNFPFWGVAGVLAFEADAFTVAVYFSNPIDYASYSMELGLELSLSKGHLGALQDTYGRLAERRSPPPTVVSASECAAVTTSHGSLRVAAGPVVVMATMANSMHSVIKLVLMDEP